MDNSVSNHLDKLVEALPGLPANAAAVFCALLVGAGREGSSEFHGTLQGVAEATGLPLAATRRALIALDQAELIGGSVQDGTLAISIRYPGAEVPGE